MGKMTVEKSNELCVAFGKKLKNLRRSFGDRQDDLTEALGWSENTVGLLETGKSSQILMYLPKILKYYGVTIEQFIREY